MKVTIERFDPTVDSAPYLKDYEVPMSDNLTVLKALVYIHENIEPIAFDYSCRGRVCGRCAMLVNGKAGTACTTAVDGSDLLIQPLPGFPVVRDLVVDKSRMYDRITRVEQRVRATQISYEEACAPVDYENVFMKLDPLEWCARCGSCQAACPVCNSTTEGGSYAGPAAMLGIALRHLDPYDQGDRVTQAVQEGLWNCVMCGMCDQVCPCLEIDHVGTWQMLRDAATERGLTDPKLPLMLY